MKKVLFFINMVIFINVYAENLKFIKVPYNANKTIEYLLRVPENFKAEENKKYRLLYFFNSGHLSAKEAHDTLFLYNPVEMKEYQVEIKMTKFDTKVLAF